ncbi:hypothetical protein SESBI_30207 [Sesbania bispinosa]|nr:hypothetical protein SESBI_30207 [Sesbania bispinosa]
MTVVGGAATAGEHLTVVVGRWELAGGPSMAEIMVNGGDSVPPFIFPIFYF